MIVKLEKYNPVKAALGVTGYYPVDITNQLTMPLNNTDRLDDTLDSSQIVLLNHDKKAIKPLTRFKITLKEEVNGETKETYIYRVAEADKPVMVACGSKPLYQHTITLLEITKLLEKDIIDNLTFTNRLIVSGSDTASVMPSPKAADIDEYEDVIANWNLWEKGGFSIGGDDYQDANEKFMSPVYVNNQFSLKPRLKDLKVVFPMLSALQVLTLKLPDLISFIISLFKKEKQNINSTGVVWLNYANKMDVILPSGGTIDASQMNSYTPTEEGLYKIRQTYKGTYKFPQAICKIIDFVNLFKKVDLPKTLEVQVGVTWNINVKVQHTDMNSEYKKYTIADVVNRTISVGKVLRTGLQAPKIELDTEIENKLSQIESPEFSFTQQTAFEAYLEVGKFIHGIPVLLPSLGNDRLWNRLSYKFLGGNEKCKELPYNLFEAEMSDENFARNVVANVQNSIVSNRDDVAGAVEPFLDGYVSTRSKSESFEISNDDAVIKVSQPIYKLYQVLMSVGEHTDIDITDCILEESKYKLLSSYVTASSTNEEQHIGNTLYYKKGSNFIAGLQMKNTDFWTALGIDLFKHPAIVNIINKKTGQSLSSIKFQNISFQIRYQPYRNFKVKQYKVDQSEIDDDCELFFNKQGNSVDIENFGQNMQGTLRRIGNEEWVKNHIVKNYSDLPKVGQVTRDGYCVYMVNSEIHNNHVAATVYYSKNYNKLNEYVGLVKTERQFEVSEEESANRNFDTQEFAIVSTRLDDLDWTIYGNTYASLEDYLSKLRGAGFASPNALRQISNRLSNKPNSYLPISYAAVYAYTQKKEELIERKYLLPASCFAMGNSLVLTLQTQDNYAAATYSNDINSDYALEKHIRAADGSGRIENFKLCFGSNEPIKGAFANSANRLKYSKQLYQLNESLNEDDIIVDYRNFPHRVDKDSRECLSFTGQLNFVTKQLNILIGKALVEAMPFLYKRNGDVAASSDNESDGSSSDNGGGSLIQPLSVSDTSTSETSVLKSEANKLTFVLFKKKPNKFADVIDTSTISTEWASPYVEDDSGASDSLIQFVGYSDNKAEVYGGQTISIEEAGEEEFTLSVNSLELPEDNIEETNGVISNVGLTGSNGDLVYTTYTKGGKVPVVETNVEAAYVKYNSVKVLTNCVGYGIIDSNNRLCIYVDHYVNKGYMTQPIYISIRSNI